MLVLIICPAVNMDRSVVVLVIVSGPDATNAISVPLNASESIEACFACHERVYVQKSLAVSNNALVMICFGQPGTSTMISLPLELKLTQEPSLSSII